MQRPEAHQEVNATTQHKLFERAAAAACAGSYVEAKRMLTQVWSAGDAALAEAAAWGIGWVLLQEREYRHAALWFERVGHVPEAAYQFWPFVRETLIEHCQTLARPAEREHGAVSPTLAPLTIVTLGSFAITRNGANLPSCNARKAQAILRYLLTRPQRRAHKDELAELLWPHVGAQDATHSLHVAVAALRRYLDPPVGSYLIFHAGDYALSPEASILDDATQFQRQIEQANGSWRRGDQSAARQALAGAVACYTGDYYVDERDATWALAERERLLMHYLDALDRLGRMLSAEGQQEAAAECFRLLLARDGYREDACANLMRCYLALGRRHDALQQYETCRVLLRNDLDLEPGDELSQLHLRIITST